MGQMYMIIERGRATRRGCVIELFHAFFRYSQFGPSLKFLPQLGSALLLLGFTTFAFAASESAAEVTPSAASPEDNKSPLTRVIDDLPEYLASRLPGLDPNGAIRIFAQPHLGDFFHQGYIRVPFGVRAKLSDHVEATTELSSYFAHGGNADGSGIAAMNLGLKCEHLMPSLNPGGISVGVNFRTPFTGTPKEFSDGYRHLQPYVAAIHPIVPRWQLLGFASLGTSFLAHTSLPSNFGRNQLHTNAIALTTGIARAWGRVHVSLTGRLASSALMSDEGRQNFTLKPEVLFPLRRDPNARMQLFVTLGARAIWGPDGRESGTNSSLRVRFSLDRNKRQRALSLADVFPH